MVLSFKASSRSEYDHACFTYYQEFHIFSFLLSRSIQHHFFQIFSQCIKSLYSIVYCWQSMHCSLQVVPSCGTGWPSEVVSQLRELFLEQPCTITPLSKAGQLTEVTLVRHNGGKIGASSPFAFVCILSLHCI